MTGTQFGLVELDLLAAYAGASIPFPLRVPTFGQYPGERDVLFGIAGATLRERELADEDGPTGLGDDLAAALAGRRGTIDLVLHGAGDPGGFVAIIEHGQALLCRQTLGAATAELVEVRSVPLDDLANTIAGLIPPLPGAKLMPTRLPTAAALVILRNNVGNRLFQIADRYGCSIDDLDAIVHAGNAATGTGQLGATVVSEHGKDVRAGAELSWVDGPGGRLRVTIEPGEDRGWVNINPLHPSDLRTAIVNMVAQVRQHRRRR